MNKNCVHGEDRDCTFQLRKMSDRNFRRFRLCGDKGGLRSSTCLLGFAHARGGPTDMGPTISPSPSSGNLPLLSSMTGSTTLVNGFSRTALEAVESGVSESPSLRRANVGASAVLIRACFFFQISSTDAHFSCVSL